MSIHIPAELLPLIKQAVADGRYANEQELVTEVLRLAIPALNGYQQLKDDVEGSVADEKAGRVKEARFERMKDRLRAEIDENDKPR